MSPEESGVGVAAAVSSPSRPNWRVVDVHVDEGEAVRSPFCHPTSEKSPAAAATAARWSDAARESALDLYERMKTCTDPYIAPVIKSALHDMEMAYRLYGPFCMVGSYNGGKDAVVIFHLMRAVHAHYCSEMEKGGADLMIPRPRVIYFQHQDEFPEVLSLLDDTVGLFDVDMLAFKEGVSFGEGLKYLVERNIAPGKNGLSNYGSADSVPPPHPLAFVLGTRKDDPNAGSQGVYAPSSHYMPPFLRVNPILDWTYGHVWHFLRFFDLPYCSLYDDGYTSLGTVKDTLPCPALRKDSDGEEYWPAYMLRDWDMERAGRVDKKKAKDKPSQSTTGQADDAKKESSVSATMSQTSSTVSLPTKEDETPKLSENMSAVWNVDDEAVKPILPESPSQLPSIGRPTVGLIVIGDELLKGMTPDSNIIAAARALRSNNVSLSRVSIISDDGQDIVNEIRRFKEEVDVIITSGGVGPTHDDVTIKSVAEALGLDLEMHYEMAELLLDKMGASDSGNEGGNDDVNSQEDPRKSMLMRQMSEGQIKMATLPKSSVLQYLTDDKDEWPALQCVNIFILPGVPAYFEKKIDQLAASSKLLQPISESIDEEDVGLSVDQADQAERRQSTPPPRSDTYRVVLSLEEESIVAALNASVAAHPHVSFGSYPIVDDPQYKTIITLEGRFYTGGYTRGSQRLLEKSIAGKPDGEGSKDEEGHDRIKSLFFSKEEMDRNVELALKDLKSRLPEEGILCIDSCDDLRIKS